MDLQKLLQNPLPIDGMASRVVRGKAEHWNPTACQNQPYFDTPPKIKPITKEHRLNPSFEDLTGRAIGLMRVHGMAAENSTKGARWVVRCQCALYIIMTAKAIKAAKDAAAVCPRCVAKRKIAGVMREDVLRAVG